MNGAVFEGVPFRQAIAHGCAPAAFRSSNMFWVLRRGRRLVDGAVFEGVPFRQAIADGCTHLVVLCTRPPFRCDVSNLYPLCLVLMLISPCASVSSGRLVGFVNMAVLHCLAAQWCQLCCSVLPVWRPKDRQCSMLLVMRCGTV